MDIKTFKIEIITAGETRHYYIKHFPEDSEDFQSFKAKILNREPDLKEKTVKYYWKDADGDEIYMVTEEDFSICIENNVKKIHVRYDDPHISIRKRSAAAANIQNSHSNNNVPRPKRTNRPDPSIEKLNLYSISSSSSNLDSSDSPTSPASPTSPISPTSPADTMKRKFPNECTLMNSKEGKKLRKSE